MQSPDIAHVIVGYRWAALNRFDAIMPSGSALVVEGPEPIELRQVMHTVTNIPRRCAT